jgi:hypothetical protein
MSRALVIVPPPQLRISGVHCPVCAEHFGIPNFRPKATIRPQAAYRLPSGTIVIENAVVVCSHCRDRGLETLL